MAQRVGKTGTLVPTGGAAYAYDERGRLLGEYDATGAVLQETVFLAEMPVGVLKQTVAGPPAAITTSVYYVYADHINTPRGITVSSIGNIVKI